MFEEFVIAISVTVIGGITLKAFNSKTQFKRALPYAFVLSIGFAVGVFIWNTAISICISEFTATHGGDETFLMESFRPHMISNYWYVLTVCAVVMLFFLNHISRASKP